ncbi:2-carboxy-1,4-naphthoquinone phytyltransferase, chloroplastic isoform X3 [Phoenix dactylifera]|uniref:2-carboxy-1,4-naphthoquinone phytyltransferase, chloroplastic isoform X3 n=1 Tax=Phoenix dactylifera TaxID=42345 RepID=A0A8B7CS41_PHODC|nr:2-carboxy-1,4-naphthoquinone phytyltransferase, chloroplastic isoform X3 [Phoenix dactylifera]
MATALPFLPLLLSKPSSPPPPSLSRRTTTRPLRKCGKLAVAARKPWPPLWPRSSSQPTPEVAREGDADEISRATLLWRAAKLPIYSVALVPLTVGSAAAYLQTGLFFAKHYFVILSASMLVITWLNLSNDVYDFDTGADRHKKESVVNIIGSRTVTQYAANISLALGFMGLIWASIEAGDVRSILLVAYAILCGYVYQCPPFRLSYQGLGEPLCFAAFGPFATTAFYFTNRSKYLTSGLSHLPLTGTVLSASVLVGLTTTFILFCSHFHQIDGDRAVGKMSPLVRIGTRAGSKVFLCALTLPVGKIVVDYVEENHNDNNKIFMAKYYCVRLHALFGIALALGLWLARAGNKA